MDKKREGTTKLRRRDYTGHKRVFLGHARGGGGGRDDALGSTKE